MEKLTKDFPSPTPIQAQGLPIVLGGENLVGIAQTGSGKTLAFLLPALAHLSRTAEEQGKGSYKGPRALILAPTRELAKQIEEVAVQFRRLAGVKTVCCIGGESRFKQLQQYDRGADLVIGTPGRINDFLESRDMSLDQCGFVVLDEADRMLDMGFEPQVRGILENVKEDRQTAMFSATWPKEVQELANEFLGDYTFMNIGSIELSANKNITQKVTVCPRDYKQEAFLGDLEGDMLGKRVLVFAERKMTVDRLERLLRNRRVPAMGIHGDKSQAQRDNTIRRFKSGDCNVMIATDVAARGLDISNVDFVVNYDFPLDIENYIHRIGRTGRANKKGTSITYMTPDDARFGDKVVAIMKEAEQEIPEELRELAVQGRHEKKKPMKGRLGRQNDFMQRRNQNQRSYGYRGLSQDDWEDDYRGGGGRGGGRSWGGNDGRGRNRWGNNDDEDFRGNRGSSSRRKPWDGDLD